MKRPRRDASVWQWRQYLRQLSDDEFRKWERRLRLEMVGISIGAVLVIVGTLVWFTFLATEFVAEARETFDSPEYVIPAVCCVAMLVYGLVRLWPNMRRLWDLLWHLWFGGDDEP